MKLFVHMLKLQCRCLFQSEESFLKGNFQEQMEGTENIVSSSRSYHGSKDYFNSPGCHWVEFFPLKDLRIVCLCQIKQMREMAQQSLAHILQTLSWFSYYVLCHDLTSQIHAQTSSYTVQMELSMFPVKRLLFSDFSDLM